MPPRGSTGELKGGGGHEGRHETKVMSEVKEMVGAASGGESVRRVMYQRQHRGTTALPIKPSMFNSDK